MLKIETAYLIFVNLSVSQTLNYMLIGLQGNLYNQIFKVFNQYPYILLHKAKKKFCSRMFCKTFEYMTLNSYYVFIIEIRFLK